MNNTYYPAITHTLELMPSEKKVIKKFTFFPKLVNIKGDLHAKVWFCNIYEHHVKRPTKKALYLEDGSPISIDVNEWSLDKITLNYEENSN